MLKYVSAKLLKKFFVYRILNDEDDSDESSGRLVIDEGQHPCNVCGQVSFQKYFNIFILKISISESQFMEIMEKQILTLAQMRRADLSQH